MLNSNMIRQITDIAKSLAIAVFLALLFRSLLFEPFNIPSGSMKSNLLVGDFLFVSKYSYGYSRYSFPLGLDVFSGRVFSSEPNRGDVIVFKLPSNPDDAYIKRLIGLPGDEIQVKRGIVYINGTAVPRKRIRNFRDINAKGTSFEIARFIETLPNGVSYEVLDAKIDSPQSDTDPGPLDNTLIYKVPDKHYFFMGDNRDNSQDSRVSVVGFVPEENLLGPARIIIFSSKAKLFEVWKWFSGLRTDRFFRQIN